MKKCLLFLVGLLLLPLCVAFTQVAGDVLRHADQEGSLFSLETGMLALGYFAWLGCWFFLPQPVKVYILGHELTHALWAIVFGGKAKNLKVSASGGSVNVTKSNVFITLAPYFFPFYTMLLIATLLIVRIFVVQLAYPLVWLFFVGFTWSFHFTFTIQSLWTHQPDIHEYGRLFSYSLIYLLNVIGIALWMVCTMSVSSGFLLDTWLFRTQDVYEQTGGFIGERVKQVVAWIKEK
jgi:hypothetical protein